MLTRTKIPADMHTKPLLYFASTLVKSMTMSMMTKNTNFNRPLKRFDKSPQTRSFPNIMSLNKVDKKQSERAIFYLLISTGLSPFICAYAGAANAC